MNTKLEEILKKGLEDGIISLSDVSSCTEEELMNRMISECHRHKIWQGKDGDFYTYIDDESKPKGIKLIHCKSKYRLEVKLLKIYHDQRHRYTFASLYKEFMQYKKSTQKQGTVMAYIKSYKRFYKDASIIHRPLDEIKVPELRAWLQSNIDEYHLTAKSYHKFSVLFRQMYEYAVGMEYIKSNPFNAIKAKSLSLYSPQTKKSSDKAFSNKEATDVCEVAMKDFEDKPYAVPLAIAFVFLTGLRIGEVVALKWSDIDYKNKVLHIRRIEQSEQENSEDFTTLTKCYHQIYDDYTKGEFGPRDVVLSDDALYLIKLLKEYYASEKMQSEWMFFNKRGKIHNRAMDIRIKKYCRQTNMDKEKSLHKVRSTYISKLRDAGMSFEKIAELVGHKSIRTTLQNYSADLKSEEENRDYVDKACSTLGLIPKVTYGNTSIYSKTMKKAPNHNDFRTSME